MNNYYVDVKCTIWERRYFKADSHDEAKQMIADNSYEVDTYEMVDNTTEEMTREENDNNDVLELYYEDEDTDALLILTQ